MVEKIHPPGGPIHPRDDAFTFAGCVAFLAPTLMIAGAAFAPTARGIWIFCVFLLPAILWVIIRRIEKKTSGYRISTVMAVLPLTGILAIVGAFLLPYAFIGLDSPFLWGLWAALATVLVAGFLVGLARHDPERQKRSIARRYRPRNGRLEIDMKKDDVMGMRDSTGSPAIDMLMKSLWWFYSGVIVIGMILGGGAAYILIDVLDGVLRMPPEMDIRVMIIELVALIGLGPLGMIMPALLVRWREIARLEKLARS